MRIPNEGHVGCLTNRFNLFQQAQGVFGPSRGLQSTIYSEGHHAFLTCVRNKPVALRLGCVRPVVPVENRCRFAAGHLLRTVQN